LEKNRKMKNILNVFLLNAFIICYLLNISLGLENELIYLREGFFQKIRWTIFLTTLKNSFFINIIFFSESTY